MMFINEAFYCIGDFLESILESDYINGAEIICKYETARLVLKGLMSDPHLMPYSIDLEDVMWDGYDKEFIISVSNNDVYCEKFIRNGKYLHCGDDAIFVFADCDKECMEHIKGETEKRQPCFMIDISDNTNDVEVTTISADGDTVGFVVTQNGKSGNIISSFSVTSNDKDYLKSIAERLNVSI